MRKRESVHVWVCAVWPIDLHSRCPVATFSLVLPHRTQTPQAEGSCLELAQGFPIQTRALECSAETDSSPPPGPVWAFPFAILLSQSCCTATLCTSRPRGGPSPGCLQRVWIELNLENEDLDCCQLPIAVTRWERGTDTFVSLPFSHTTLKRSVRGRQSQSLILVHSLNSSEWALVHKTCGKQSSTVSAPIKHKLLWHPTKCQEPIQQSFIIKM